MAVFEKWFKQDLLEPIKIHSVGDLVFTEDNLSNVVGVELFRGGRTADISGSVVCNVIRADGRTVVVTGELSGNKLSVTLPKAAMSVPGKVGVMLQLVTGEVKTTVLKVVLFSNQEMTDTIVDPEHIVPDISDVIAQMAAMEAATEAAQDAADELNSGMADIIKIQSTEPVEEYNKVWFDTSTDDEITVPEYGEFEELSEEVDDLKNAVSETLAINEIPEQVFSFDNNFISTTVNGVQVERIGNSVIKLNGTCSANGNINYSFKGYAVSEGLSTHMIKTSEPVTSAQLTVGIGCFLADDTAWGGYTYSAFNEAFNVSYPSNAALSRDYLSIKAGVTYNDLYVEFITTFGASFSEDFNRVKQSFGNFGLAFSEWVRMTLNGSDGQPLASPNRISLENRFYAAGNGQITIYPNGQKVWWYKYQTPTGNKTDSATAWQTTDFALQMNAGEYFNVAVARTNDATIDTVDLQALFKFDFLPAEMDTEEVSAIDNYKNSPSIIGVAHRGLSYSYPENTMIAFSEARKAGFRYIEFDIQWTSDDVPVVLHDQTINRTGRNSDGTSIQSTININSITYDQALTYDFGIYKGSSFAGTKLPKFVDVLRFCKYTGTIPIIEIKLETNTTSTVDKLISIVRENGMIDVAEWLVTQSNGEMLLYIKSQLPTATLWYAVYNTFTQGLADVFASLKTNDNKVNGMFPPSMQTSESIELMIDNGIPYSNGEPINTENGIINANPYMSIVLSERYLPEKILYENAFN